MTKETRCIDEAICPRCKMRFNGDSAVNYEIGTKIIKCPNCNTEIEIYTSVEYQCRLIKGED